MKKLAVAVAALAMVSTVTCQVQAESIIDDFARYDSASVGNGWSEGNQWGQLTGLEILDNQLAAASGFGMIHRTIDQQWPVRVRAILHPGGCWNYSSDQNHMNAAFSIASDAQNLFSGYGITVFRGDSNDASPQVCRIAGEQTESCTTFGLWPTTLSDVAIDLTISENGAINGNVTSIMNGSSIGVNFGAMQIPNSGSELQVTIMTACPANPQTIDDLLVDIGQTGFTTTPTPTVTQTPSRTSTGGEQITNTPTRTPTRTNTSWMPTKTPVCSKTPTSCNTALPTKSATHGHSGPDDGHHGGGGGGCQIDSVTTNNRLGGLMLLLPLAGMFIRRRSR